LSVSAAGYGTSSRTINCSTPTVSVDLQPETGSIILRYVGDYAACSLVLNVKIANKAFRPTSNVFPVDDIALGNQRYTIQGTIGCLIGVCNASGSGQIDIEDGATYDVGWVNTAYGQCTVVLARSE